MQDDGYKLIEQLAAKYSHIQTYQDVGETWTTDHHGTVNEGQSSFHFSTSFKRPDLFRFECSENSEIRYLLISDGTTIYEDNGWEIARPSSVTFAKNGSFAVLAGVAPPILQFLMPNLSGKATQNLKDIQLMTSEQLHNEPCHLLQTTIVDVLSPRQTDLWISKERLIFRKIQEAFTLDPIRIDVWKSQNEMPTENFEELVEQAKSRQRLILEKYFPRKSNLEIAKRDRLERSLRPRSIIYATSYDNVSINTELPDNLFSMPTNRVIH